MFQNSSDTIDLFDTVIQLRDGGIADQSARPGITDLGSWSVATIRADDGRALHPDVWECHPSGQEVLCVLSGAVDVYLRDHAEGREPVAGLTPGRAFVVPAGHWHRLVVREPAELIAITPRAETRHERVEHDPAGLGVSA